MARTVHEARLGSPTARAKLKPGRQPHWNTIIHARDHLGWQKWPQDKAGRWVLRTRRGGEYSTQSIGAADDAQKADGLSIFNYQQARERAVELSSVADNRSSGKLTVQRAMADYIDYLDSQGKSKRDAESAAVVHILPALGDVEVASLTSAQLQRWLALVASRPAQKRTGAGKPQKFKSIDGDEEVRRRRASANNVFSILRAALNLAFDQKRVADNTAWGRRVKKFRGVDAARVRYLSIDESVRLINASDPAFRPLVRAALETGCRYQELARLEVCDLNADAGALHIRKSKTNRQRHVVLTAEGVAFFTKVCAGRKGSELMFPRSNGEPWRASNQERFIAEANQRANIVPPITFHTLRHTYASLCIMNGVPLMVVARNLGHANTKMVESVYGHLSQGYVFEAIRAGAPRFAVGEHTNVAPMKLVTKKKHP
jgi:integrase